MKKVLLIASIFCIIFPSMCWAMERFSIVTTSDMETMLEQRAKGDLVFILVKSLDECLFRAHSIPGSINLLWSRVDSCIGRLGYDKDRLIVVY